MKLNGKIAIVTGGASGIGKACAEKFASEGARVIIADIQDDAGNAVATSLHGRYVKTDVTNPNEVQSLIAQTVDAFGKLDILMNNAGMDGEQKPIAECTLENWSRVIDLNLNGVFYGMKYGLAQMAKQQRGVILNTASIAGLVAFPNIAAYCAAKAGVIHLTRTAAIEYAKQNIRVNALCPSVVKTPLVKHFITSTPDPDATRQWFENFNMKLSATDYSLLRELQQNEKHKRNYVKITVLLMLHLGKSAEEIGLCLGISAATVSNYEKKYEQLGLDSYLEDNYVAYQGKLTPEEQAILVQELSENLYQNTAQIVHFISERFGKKYTCQGVVPLLHRLGFSYKKTKLVPCQADLSQQVAFVDTLNTLKASLESDSAVLYFADAVHPQHNTRSSYAWIPKGQEKELPSVSGRQRLNCNGAINPFKVSDMEVRFDTCINAQSTWLLYKQLEEKHSDKACIYVVCDNARYYKNKWLQEQLQGSKIKQIFLPAYSPNLNLIERLWKFMRKKVIDTHFYRTFEEFRQKILAFFEHIEQYKQELETLISWNFHIPKTQTTFY